MQDMVTNRIWADHVRRLASGSGRAETRAIARPDPADPDRLSLVGRMVALMLALGLSSLILGVAVI